MIDKSLIYPDTRFLADAMLGRLAHWLRALGFDTVFKPSPPDAELVAQAREEDRLLLTRDRHLVTHLRPERALLLASQDPLEQLREVVESCQLAPPFALFRRCLRCNLPLREAEPEEIEALIPPQARSLDGPFLRCPQCGRAYWEGTHVRRMRETLAASFPEWEGL